MTTERDIKNQIFYAETMGQRKGREEGIRDNQRETARRMLALSMDLAVIAQVSGLTPEEIQAL
ncbi:MAG: hypothetical protein IJ721_03725 [Bacteroidales bacterium]|nr:hypothetical protein [Bacteroidales bacterium]